MHASEERHETGASLSSQTRSVHCIFPFLILLLLRIA